MVCLMMILKRISKTNILFNNWFCQTGPYASRPGYDGLIQAMGGVMALTGEPNGEPMKVGFQLVI